MTTRMTLNLAADVLLLAGARLRSAIGTAPRRARSSGVPAA
jgi:hypothetical protein